MSRAPNAERAKQDESLCSALLTDSSRQICGVKKALPIVVRLQVLAGHLPWQSSGLEQVLGASHNSGMASNRDDMEEISQLATAMVAVVFAAVLLVSGLLFIDYRSSKSFGTPAVAAVTLRGEKTR